MKKFIKLHSLTHSPDFHGFDCVLGTGADGADLYL